MNEEKLYDGRLDQPSPRYKNPPRLAPDGVAEPVELKVPLALLDQIRFTMVDLTQDLRHEIMQRYAAAGVKGNPTLMRRQSAELEVVNRGNALIELLAEKIGQ